jgi:hypothetical protein
MSRDHELPKKYTLLELIRRNVRWHYMSTHTQVANLNIAISFPTDTALRDASCTASN